MITIKNFPETSGDESFNEVDNLSLEAPEYFFIVFALCGNNIKQHNSFVSFLKVYCDYIFALYYSVFIIVKISFSPTI